MILEIQAFWGICGLALYAVSVKAGTEGWKYGFTNEEMKTIIREHNWVRNNATDAANMQFMVSRKCVNLCYEL